MQHLAREIEGCIRQYCAGGVAADGVADGGDGADGVAVARDHPPDGVPPFPAYCCPGRPAGSMIANAPATMRN